MICPSFHCNFQPSTSSANFHLSSFSHLFLIPQIAERLPLCHRVLNKIMGWLHRLLRRCSGSPSIITCGKTRTQSPIQQSIEGLKDCPFKDYSYSTSGESICACYPCAVAMLVFFAVPILSGVSGGSDSFYDRAVRFV